MSEQMSIVQFNVDFSFANYLVKVCWPQLSTMSLI